LNECEIARVRDDVDYADCEEDCKRGKADVEKIEVYWCKGM
jgi:hypothetical protein